MVKVLRAVAVGLASTTLAVLVGCSQASQSEAPAPATNASDSAPAEETTAAEQDNPSAQTEASSEAENTYRPVENITFPAPGNDPLAMVFGLRQFTGEAVGSEQLKVTYPASDQAIVVTTVRGLPDDSVNALRTRYEFKSVEGQPGQWQMVNVSQQNKCKAGRGSEEWTADLCQ